MPAQPASETKTEPVAVILVGGIFASHLVDPRGGLAWPVNRTAAMLRHIIDSPVQQRKAFSEENAVRFLARGSRSILPSTLPSHVDAGSGWQDVFLKSYSAFLTACANAGPNTNPALPFQPFVYALGYNFTRSNRVTSWRYIVPQTLHILQAVRTATNKLNDPNNPATDRGPLPRFIFVTHSMGALAVRYTLKRNPALRKNCICVVHVAAPNAGAPETLARFVRGSEDRPPVSLIFGNRGWKCLTSASTIGAGFELLPFPMLRQKGAFKGFDVITPKVTSATDPAFHFEKIINTQFTDPGPNSRTVNVTTLPGSPTSFSIPDRGDIFRYRTARKQKDAITSEIISGHTDGQGRLIAGHLKAAQSFHDELGDYLFERTGAVVLDGKPTVQKIQFTFDTSGILTDVIETFNQDGDGTVPKESQRYLIPPEVVGKGGLRFNPIVPVSGVAHADALSEEAKKKDPQIFVNIFRLITDLYHTAPPPELKVPVKAPLEPSVKTLLAAFHAGKS